MRFKNPRVISEVTVYAASSAISPEERYGKKRAEFHQDNWFEWPRSDAYLLRRRVGTHGFTAVVLDYDIPTDNIQPGLSRREAVQMLRRMGLREPTHGETFLLASQEIWQGNFFSVMRKEYDPKRPIRYRTKQPEDRNICSPVSINIEFPFYYCFSFYGVRGTAKFTREGYGLVEERDDLYFAYHRDGRFGEKKTALPLILGIRPDSLNQELMPAKMNVEMGAHVHKHGNSQAWWCPRCQHNESISAQWVGTSASSQQCIECDHVFHIHLEQ